MNDRSRMSDQLALPGIGNVISSQALGSGPLPSVSQDGPTTGPCGPDPVLASLSPRQAKAAGLLTSGTCGRRGSTSSASVSLRSFLESRLRERTAVLGSTLFTLTWKVWVTPAGLSLPLLRASVRRKEGTGSTLLPWPTPRTPTGGPESGERKQGLGRTESGGGDLQAAALMASWATPRSEDGECAGMRHSRGVADTLTAQSSLASWVSPTARDHSRGGKDARPHDTGVPLSQQAVLASWPTPTTRDHKDGDAKSCENVPVNALLGRTAVLAMASGPTPNGSPAGTGSAGQLNPALSRWLQGCPEAWDRCSPNYDDWRKWQDFMAAHSNGPRGIEQED